MTAGSTDGDAWVDVVESLLDVRSDPATDRFDADLAAAVADGSVTPEAAHRLRFWQRASLRALADHVRTVLPVALGALDAARHDAEEYVEGSATLLDTVAAEPSADVPTRRASATAPPARATLGPAGPRLLVAGLTTVPPHTDRTS